jgi:hypothetical protein
MEVDKMSSVGSGSVGAAQRQSSGISVSGQMDTKESTGTIKAVDLMHLHNDASLVPADEGEAIHMKINE